MKEARDRQQLKEREEEQLQHQKAKANRHREEARQAKARISGEKENADRAADKASRAAARKTHQRLEQALKTSQKCKKRSLNALMGSSLKKRSIVRPRGSGEPQGAAAGAPTIQTRRGRTINTPTRYL